MAVREPLSTAKKYMTHGAAAYDVRRKEKLDPVELPEEREAPARIHRVRATPHVSPFAVIGMAVTAFLAMLVVFGYVRLYEADSAVSELEDQLFQLQTEQARLESSYENKIDLEEVETRAEEMGMSKPKSSQTVYLSLNSEDRAVVTPAEKSNIFVTVYRAIRDSIKGFVEYLF